MKGLETGLDLGLQSDMGEIECREQEVGVHVGLGYV